MYSIIRGGKVFSTVFPHLLLLYIPLPCGNLSFNAFVSLRLHDAHVLISPRSHAVHTVRTYSISPSKSFCPPRGGGVIVLFLNWYTWCTMYYSIPGITLICVCEENPVVYGTAIESRLFMALRLRAIFDVPAPLHRLAAVVSSTDVGQVTRGHPGEAAHVVLS